MRKRNFSDSISPSEEPEKDHLMLPQKWGNIESLLNVVYKFCNFFECELILHPLRMANLNFQVDISSRTRSVNNTAVKNQKL